MGKFHDQLIAAVFDGDLQTKMHGIMFSTSLREILTVEDVEEHYKGGNYDELN